MTTFPRHLSRLAALAALSLSAHATEAPKHVDVKQLSKKVEDVVVPLPNEVFGALNKLGGVNWHEYVRNDKFQARSFFSQNVPELRRNEFGGTLRGPSRCRRRTRRP